MPELHLTHTCHPLYPPRPSGDLSLLWFISRPFGGFYRLMGEDQMPVWCDSGVVHINTVKYNLPYLHVSVYKS